MRPMMVWLVHSGWCAPLATLSELLLLGSWKTIRLRITPTVNRNSYRVARLVGALTQGSVLRPQPWAGETQLRQSCCCLRIAYNNSPRCFCLRFPAYNNSPCCFCLLGHAPFSLYLFTINTWIGGEIGTAIIIIMIYYKKTAHHFAQIEIMAIFAHHHLYLCHNH